MIFWGLSYAGSGKFPTGSVYSVQVQHGGGGGEEGAPVRAAARDHEPRDSRHVQVAPVRRSYGTLPSLTDGYFFI